MSGFVLALLPAEVQGTSMMHLLFPGRHHLLTTFQLQYLTMVTKAEPGAVRDVNGEPLELKGPISTVVWAVGTDGIPGHQHAPNCRKGLGELDWRD